MKVTFYNRDIRQGNYSIEELFKNIKKQLPDHISIKEFFASKDKLQDILRSKKYQGEVNHITGDVNYLSFGLPGHRTILTIHDLGHYEITLKGFKKAIYKYLWLYFPLKKVKYITTISEFTKKAILKHFNIDPEKIIVIHNPYPSTYTYSPKEFNNLKPIILQIGTGKNKNVERLIDALKGITCKLVLIRKPTPSLILALKNANIDYELYYELSSEEIYQKYLECDLVFFASTYEGFGLPIVEANAIGRPIITSNVASMPEIAVDAACLVDPYDVSSIKNGILKIINDQSFRDDLIQKGRKNIKRFEIETIADQYVELYKKICLK